MNTTTPPPPRAPQLPLATPVAPVRPQHRQPIFELPTLRFGAATAGLVIAAAVFGDIAAFAGGASLAGFLAVAVAAYTMHRAGLSASGRGAALLIGAVLTAAWLPVRASWALEALNVLTSLGLLAAAAVLHRVDRLRPVISIVSGVIKRMMQGVYGPLVLLRSVPIPSGSRVSANVVVAVLRGAVLAAAPVALLAALLASADRVFASLFRLELGTDVDRLVPHVVLVGVLASSLAGLLCVAESRRVDDAPVKRLIGGIEALVVLGAIVVLFSAFAVTQIVVAMGGAAHVLETAGLTQATYAREGFFQLLAVAAFTLCFVIGIAAFARIESVGQKIAYRVSATLVSLLTVSIVVVSVSRLNLYADAFGLTMLRLLSTGFALLLGVVFLLFALSSALGGGHRWFWTGSVAAAVAALVILNAINPEALIARTNIEQAAATGSPLDASYLLDLSADALPTMIEAIPEVVVDRGCGSLEYGKFDGSYGALGSNRADRNAKAALEVLCAEDPN